MKSVLSGSSNSGLSAAEVRSLCRAGRWQGPTTGLAPGRVQANLVILEAAYAFDFLLFCQRNPKPCPLVEVLEAGTVAPLGAPGADIRTDLPGYRVYRHGVLTEERAEIATIWQEDWVTFLIGCSFSFEAALMRAGIVLRHLAQGRNVAMYRTALDCQPAGRLHGRLVVSMRPIREDQVDLAIAISARYPMVHGAPIQIGEPERLGIRDLAVPDFGDPVAIEAGEIPVFWACGVTPQAVLQSSRIPLCITHVPGAMFITDRPTEDLA